MRFYEGVYKIIEISNIILSNIFEVGWDRVGAG
jgi:hypothetical protein